MFNLEVFDRIINLAWWGKIVNEVQCMAETRNDDQQSTPQLRPVFIGWNNVMSELLVPFTTRLGPVQENLSPGKCDLVGL